MTKRLSFSDLVSRVNTIVLETDLEEARSKNYLIAGTTPVSGGPSGTAPSPVDDYAQTYENKLSLAYAPIK